MASSGHHFETHSEDYVKDVRIRFREQAARFLEDVSLDVGAVLARDLSLQDEDTKVEMRRFRCSLFLVSSFQREHLVVFLCHSCERSTFPEDWVFKVLRFCNRIAIWILTWKMAQFRLSELQKGLSEQVQHMQKVIKKDKSVLVASTVHRVLLFFATLNDGSAVILIHCNSAQERNSFHTERAQDAS